MAYTRRLILISGTCGLGLLNIAANHFNPQAINSRWDLTSNNGSINDGAGTWNDTSLFTYDNGGHNSLFVPGSNVVFGGGSSGTGGTVTAAGTKPIYSLTFNTAFGATPYTLAGTLPTRTGSSITVNDTKGATISAVIGGAMGVTKKGTGTLTLSVANSYSGDTTLSTGTLVGNNAAAFGTGTITLGDASSSTSGMTLQLNADTINNNITVSTSGTGTKTIYGTAQYKSQSGTITVPSGSTVTLSTYDAGGADWWYNFAGKISGSGTIKLDSGAAPNASRLTLNNAASDFAGSWVAVSGRIQTQGANAFGSGSADLNTGTAGTSDFRLYGTTAYTIPVDALNGSGDIFNDQGTNYVTLSVGNNNGGGSYSGDLGSGGTRIHLVKNGSGNQGIYGTNTYTGTSTVNGGQLIVYTPSGLGSTSRITIANGAMLWLNTTGSGQDYTFPVTFAASTGALWFGQVDYARDNTWSGNMTLTGNAAISGSKSGGIARLTGVLSGAGALTLSYGGGGGAAFYVTGNNTYTGGTTITTGTVNCGHANALGTTGAITVNAGAVLDKNGTGCGGARITCNGTCIP